MQPGKDTVVEVHSRPFLRAPLPAQRWFGRWRGLLWPLWPGMPAAAATQGSSSNASATRHCGVQAGAALRVVVGFVS